MHIGWLNPHLIRLSAPLGSPAHRPQAAQAWSKASKEVIDVPQSIDLDYDYGDYLLEMGSIGKKTTRNSDELKKKNKTSNISQMTAMIY